MRTLSSLAALTALTAALVLTCVLPAAAQDGAVGDRTLLLVGIIVSAGALCIALVVAAVWFFVRVGKGKEKVEGLPHATPEGGCRSSRRGA